MDVHIDYYNQVGCGTCSVFEKVLEGVIADGEYSLNVTEYEVRLNPGNFQRLNDTYSRFGIPVSEWGTPTIVLNNSMVHIGAVNKEEFESLLDACIAGGCNASVAGNVTQVDILNPLAVFGAGVISGFNPCLIAVLLFLISYSLGVSENKLRLVKLTIAFSFGIFTAYFIIGWGLLSFASMVDIELITILIAWLVIVLGLWTIKDYKNPKSFLVETPENIKGVSESLTKKNSMITSFILGGIFSLVKAPCVGGIYLAILNMASSADIGVKINAAPLLFLYNLGLIFPLLIISGAVLLGVPPDTIERWREKNKYGMRIFIGITLVLVGIVMLWQIGWLASPGL
ncbi:MAG: cytochrome c biogenesis CcdA family protein [Candidatus Micrarchaeota archaeon]